VIDFSSVIDFSLCRHHYKLSTQGVHMPLNIRDEAVNQLAEQLAAIKRTTKTEAVKFALQSELHRIKKAVPLRDRVKALQERVMARPATGLEADKEFYDALSGDD